MLKSYRLLQLLKANSWLCAELEVEICVNRKSRIYHNEPTSTHWDKKVTKKLNNWAFSHFKMPLKSFDFGISFSKNASQNDSFFELFQIDIFQCVTTNIRKRKLMPHLGFGRGFSPSCLANLAAHAKIFLRFFHRLHFVVTRSVYSPYKDSLHTKCMIKHIISCLRFFARSKGKGLALIFEAESYFEYKVKNKPTLWKKGGKVGSSTGTAGSLPWHNMLSDSPQANYDHGNK